MFFPPKHFFKVGGKPAAAQTPLVIGSRKTIHIKLFQQYPYTVQVSLETNYRPSDRVRKKMENYVKIFGNIMRKRVTIMQKKCQIMQKFLKLIKLFPWLFPTYKIPVKILLRILVLYDVFDILLPFVDRYFFVQCSFFFPIVFVVEFVPSLVTSH